MKCIITASCEISLVVELVLPKHRARVRFSYSALAFSTQLVQPLAVSLAVIDF
ncbi:MAG: hypothetical protein UW86_C0015G0001, partial [Microgenomates group bacterium GW2011_GWA1_Microgenomates_45_10]